MQLISLKLLNFRRFREQEIFFQEDFTLVFWKNGAGKSSILDAIWFSLFWPTGDDFVRVSRELLRSDFLDGREPSKVELNFQFGMDSYRVVRVIDAGIKTFASDFILEQKDILIWPSGLEIAWWSKITEYIEQLIWVTRDTFLKSVFTAQKDIEVLSGWAFERKKLINTILWLDKVEYIINFDLKSEHRNLKNKLTSIKMLLEWFDKEDYKSREKEISDELKNLEINMKSKKKDLIKLEKDLDESKTLLESQNKSRDIHLKLNSSVEKYMNSLEYLNKNLDTLWKNLDEIVLKEKYLKTQETLVEDMAKNLERLSLERQNKLIYDNLLKYKKELEILNQKLDTINKSLESDDYRDLKQSIDTSKRDKLSLEWMLSDLRVKKSEYISTKKTIELDGRGLQRELDDINKLWRDADCPTCKRPLLDHLPRLIGSFNSQIKLKRESWSEYNTLERNLDIEIKVLDEKINTIKTTLERLDKSRLEYIRLKEQQKNLLENILSKDRDIENIWDIKFDEKVLLELETTQKTLDIEYEIYIKSLELIKNKSRFEKELSDTKNTIKDTNISLNDDKKSLNELWFNQKYFDEIKLKNRDLLLSYNELRDAMHKIEKDILNTNNNLNNLRLKQEEFRQNQALESTTIDKLEMINLQIQILTDYMEYLLDYLKPHIETIASSYFTTITGGKYLEISLDSDYNILIDGKTIKLYSWGEKDLANLCLRLALWQNLSTSRWNPIGFLILDEVLSSQDISRQENILYNLSRLDSKFNQVILISHLEWLKEFANNLIEVENISTVESRVVYH